jgi:hypothetical protein
VGIGEFQTLHFQGSKQLPPAVPLTHNYNSVELFTTATPDAVFARYMQRFLGVQPGHNNVATVPPTTNITESGQLLTFTLVGVATLLQGPFSVGIERFDPVNHVISAVTLRGHPLAGWRYFRVYSIAPNDVVVETGAVDTAGPGPPN